MTDNSEYIINEYYKYDITIPTNSTTGIHTKNSELIFNKFIVDVCINITLDNFNSIPANNQNNLESISNELIYYHNGFITSLDLYSYYKYINDNTYDPNNIEKKIDLPNDLKFYFRYRLSRVHENSTYSYHILDKNNQNENLLRHIIPHNYDSTYQTYEVILEKRNNIGKFNNIMMNSWPHYAIIDYKHGYLYFNQENSQNIDNLKYFDENDELFLTFIRYEGNFGAVTGGGNSGESNTEISFNREVSLNFFQDLNNTVQYKFKKFINDSQKNTNDIDIHNVLSEWFKADDFSMNIKQDFSDSIFEIKAQIQYFTSAATNSLLNIKLVKEYLDSSDDLIEYDYLGGYQLFTQLTNTLNVHYYDNDIINGIEYTYQFYYQLYYLGTNENYGSINISFGFISGSDNSYNNILIREFKYKNLNDNGNNFYNFYNNYSNNDKILDNNITIQESYKNNFTVNNLVSAPPPDISFHDSSYNITFKPINNNNNLLLEYNIFYKNAFQADENI